MTIAQYFQAGPIVAKIQDYEKAIEFAKDKNIVEIKMKDMDSGAGFNLLGDAVDLNVYTQLVKVELNQRLEALKRELAAL